MTDKELNAEITAFLNKYFQGKAWFNGGSYSYLFDTKHPRTIRTSDGGKLPAKNFVDAIKGWADRGIYEDFSDCDGAHWKEFFRSAIRNQEDHELRNL
jgi:hypothetical protein